MIFKTNSTSKKQGVINYTDMFLKHQVLPHHNFDPKCSPIIANT